MTGGRAHGIWAVGKEITYMSGYLPDLSPLFFFFAQFFPFTMLIVLTWRFDERCPLQQQKQYSAFSVGPTFPISSLALCCAGRVHTSARPSRFRIIALRSPSLCCHTSSTTSSRRRSLRRPISTSYLTFLLPPMVVKSRLHSAHSRGDTTQTVLVQKEVTFLWLCVGDMKP
jgi:hypothetical protein